MCLSMLFTDQVGSMLKTPKFPVWVVKTGERYGVLFSLNKDLVNDWSVNVLRDYLSKRFLFNYVYFEVFLATYKITFKLKDT